MLGEIPETLLIESFSRHFRIDPVLRLKMAEEQLTTPHRSAQNNKAAVYVVL